MFGSSRRRRTPASDRPSLGPGAPLTWAPLNRVSDVHDGRKRARNIATMLITRQTRAYTNGIPSAKAVFQNAGYSISRPPMTCFAGSPGSCTAISKEAGSRRNRRALPSPRLETDDVYGGADDRPTDGIARMPERGRLSTIAASRNNAMTNRCPGVTLRSR